MKKLMVLAAMLAMMLAMAAPALAQATAIDDGDDVEFNAVGQNIIGSVGDITTGSNTANANASATTSVVAGGGSTVAVHNSATGGSITQDSGVSISQVNEVGNLYFGHWVFLF
jgi:hypothetical protein